MRVGNKVRYDIENKECYLEAWKMEPDNYTALHQYILCLLYEKPFVDEEGMQDEGLIDELKNRLKEIVYSDQAEPYEVLFSYEFHRAIGGMEEIEAWFREYPEYRELCRLKLLSYEFYV